MPPWRAVLILDPSFADRIMAGQLGVWGTSIRAVLATGEAAYRYLIDRRNAHYDRCGPRYTPAAPVISVGNITVGGTGKTPLVIDIVRRLEGMGRSPAVVARGYKSPAGEPNDEEQLIRARCPGVVYVADADRAAACDVAIRCFGADVVVLDDGFQHRRLARNVDIVVIDATCPFGYEHLLPRGLLREPLRSLRRAQVLILTRCEQVGQVERLRIEERLREIHGDAMLLRCNHRVAQVSRLNGEVIGEDLRGKRAVLFAAIGNPRAFLGTAAALGVEIVGHRWFRDHYHYRPKDVTALLKPGRFPPHDLLLTTEKDAVKLAGLRVDHLPIYVVCIDIDFEDHGGTILDTILQNMLHGHRLNAGATQDRCTGSMQETGARQDGLRHDATLSSD